MTHKHLFSNIDWTLIGKSKCFCNLSVHLRMSSVLLFFLTKIINNYLFSSTITIKYWQWKTNLWRKLNNFAFYHHILSHCWCEQKNNQASDISQETSGGDVMTTVLYLKISGNLIAFHFLFKTTFLLRLLMTLNKHKKQLMDGCRSMWHSDNESVLLQWLVTITPDSSALCNLQKKRCWHMKQKIY